jgi:hypothetical protein
VGFTGKKIFVLLHRGVNLMASVNRTLVSLQKLYEKRRALGNRIIRTENKLIAEAKKAAEPPKKRGRKPAA